jgi:hypothetical protein
MPRRPSTTPSAGSLTSASRGHADDRALDLASLGVSDERCKWPNTLSYGLAGKGRYDRNTGGRESATIEGSG